MDHSYFLRRSRKRYYQFGARNRFSENHILALKSNEPPPKESPKIQNEELDDLSVDDTSQKENSEPFVGRKHKCSVCNEVFNIDTELHEHRDVHSENKPSGSKDKNEEKDKDAKILQSNQCSVCGKQFKSRSAVLIHMRFHTGYKPFVCNTCGKRFTLNHHLIEHNRIHTGERPYQCNICGKMFAQKSKLFRHINIHTREKLFNCTVCEKVFTDPSSHRAHTRLHSGHRPFSCKICDKKFKDPSLLRIHTRIHTGEKPYLCTTCNKAYISKSALNLHSRIHSGKKLFHCIVCKKGFRQSAHLSQHMRVHTGERPYQCEVCGKKFTHKSSLYSHVKSHNSSKPNQKQKSHCNNSNVVKLDIDGEPLCETTVIVKSKSYYQIKLNPEENSSGDNTCDKDCNTNIVEGVDGTTSVDQSTTGVIHTIEEIFTCYFCSEAFTSIASLDIHTKKHIGEKLYQCKFGDELSIITSGNALFQKSRMIEHSENCDFPNSSGPEQASQSSTTVANTNEIVQDQNGHYYNNNNNVGYQFILLETADGTRSINDSEIDKDGISQVPMDQIDEDDRELLMCDVCSETFIKEDDLLSHQRTHTTDNSFMQIQSEDKIYHCVPCDQIFTTESDFAVHLKLHAEENVVCDVCQTVLSCSSAMDEHMKMHEERHRCNICDKFFSHINSLKIHLSSHTGNTKEFRIEHTNQYNGENSYTQG